MTDAAIIQQALPRIADWYSRSRRVLPWREDPTPYRIWISEIMLQQTRIEAVIAYYRRFLEELPDVQTLAAVDEDRLLKLWEGLGYYSRARNLKKAAQTVMRDYGGELPRTAAELKKLPGVGDYTAGAIASIACGEPEPAVDGNVLRVLSRLLASEADILAPGTKKAMTALLREHYPVGEAAALTTEGLMELGEVICGPSGAPRCGLCPLRGLCRAAADGTAERYPVKTPPRPRRVEARTVLLLRCGGRWAIRQREKKGLLAGLWEFPGEAGFLDATALRERFPQALSVRPCGRAKHVFTHVEWHMEGWLLELPEEFPGFVWESAAAIRARYSVPTALKAYLAQIE
jgi:A/G-specific adenine glycosylase